MFDSSNSGLTEIKFSLVKNAYCSGLHLEISLYNTK